MIGYYVHHQGAGHLARARALADALAERGGPGLTVLSSLPRPCDWGAGWVSLARDDGGPADGPPRHPTAGGRLHWAPLAHPGLRERMSAISCWLAEAAPAAVVVDVSVEVLALVRLHGVATVGVVLPGERGDAAHLLGLDLADELVGFWPAAAQCVLGGPPDATRRRVRALGALSSRPPAPVVDRAPGGAAGRSPGGGRVVLLGGAGGTTVGEAEVAAAVAQTPDWSWTVLGAAGASWVDDPGPAVRSADVVVTHAGQNAVAEVAQARRPAVVLPQPRPHDEQVATGRVLERLGMPVAVLPRWPGQGWASLLARTAALDGRRWAAVVRRRGARPVRRRGARGRRWLSSGLSRAWAC